MNIESRDAAMDSGNLALATGELEEAVRCYRSAVDMDPGYFDGWHALGMALMKCNRFPEAIEAGNRAVQINPNDMMAWTSLSLAYVRNHQVPEAEAAGAKAKIISWGGKIKLDDDASPSRSNI